MKSIFSFRCREVLLIALFVFFIASGSAFGAGFSIIEQSVSGLGNAFAGGAAGAEDATTIFYNPAGLTRLQGSQFIAAGHIIIPTAKFKNEGSTHVLQAMTGIPLTGSNGGDGGETGYVPNAYFSSRLNERVTLGIGINAPFGLETDYDSGWVGRYHALNSKVQTININPSLAVKVNDHLSIGGGIDIQYIKAELSSAIDFGTLDAIGAFSALGIPAGALGLIPQGSDGLASLEGDSWGLGFNAGILYEFNGNTRAGLAYRSRITHTLEGDADFSGVPAGLAAAPLFKDGDIEASISLPDIASFSLYHQINPYFAVMADITWTNWSLFDELRVEFDNPYQDDSVTTTDWEDNFRYSLGLSYMPNDQWTFRTGCAFDETPIPDAQHRTPRIPGEDRLWVAGGIGFRLSSAFSIDAAYAHLFIDDPEVNKDITDPENAVRGGLKGTYDADVNIISAQIKWIF